MIKVLQRIKVTVREPFSGGQLIVKVGGIQVLPPIPLAGVREPNYEGISPDIVAYDKCHRKKGGYIWLSDELPHIAVDGDCVPEIVGEPVNNVETEFTYYKQL